MNVRKVLHVKTHELDEHIEFGIPDTKEEIEKCFALRYAIYAKYGYLDLVQYTERMEIDRYDTSNQSVYFAAKIKDRFIGVVRLIKTGTFPLPTTVNFSFSVPPTLSDIPPQQGCEIGRLVVDKYSEKVYLPRNVILLFLISDLVEYGQNHNLTFAYAFLKKHLVGKLDKLGLPYNRIEPFSLEYKESGPMAPYFFNEEDPVYPAYFKLTDIEEFVEKTIKNKMLFKKTENNHFIFQNNLYTRFLKTVKVI